VNADDHVDDELQDTEDVWVVGARVGAIKELEHAPHTKNTVDAHEREVNAKQQVEQVGKHGLKVRQVDYHGVMEVQDVERYWITGKIRYISRTTVYNQTEMCKVEQVGGQETDDVNRELPGILQVTGVTRDTGVHT